MGVCMYGADQHKINHGKPWAPWEVIMLKEFIMNGDDSAGEALLLLRSIRSVALQAKTQGLIIGEIAEIDEKLTNCKIH